MLFLSGKARVGKTTAAKLLAELLYKQGYKPIILPFAAALKAEVEATGLTKESDPEQYRLVCQKMGSDRRRENPDYWVDKFLESAYKILKEENSEEDVPERVIIVDDCRYLNELNLAPRFNAIKIFISHGDRRLMEHDEPWRLHESEDMANRTEDNDKDYREMYHFVLRNDKDEKSFKKKISNYYNIIMDCAYNIVLEPLCECELCMATRYDRNVDITVLNEQIIDTLKEAFPDTDEEYEDDGA
jgi:DNA polymerase III delta prime subunit